jgi:hypothetical protein
MGFTSSKSTENQENSISFREALGILSFNKKDESKKPLLKNFNKQTSIK